MENHTKLRTIEEMVSQAITEVYELTLAFTADTINQDELLDEINTINQKLIIALMGREVEKIKTAKLTTVEELKKITFDILNSRNKNEN